MMDKLHQAFMDLKVVNLANDIGVNYHTIYSRVDKKVRPKNIELLQAMDQWLTEVKALHALRSTHLAPKYIERDTDTF